MPRTEKQTDFVDVGRWIGLIEKTLSGGEYDPEDARVWALSTDASDAMRGIFLQVGTLIADNERLQKELSDALAVPYYANKKLVVRSK